MFISDESKAKLSEAASYDEASQAIYGDTDDVRATAGADDTYAISDNTYSSEPKLAVLLRGKPSGKPPTFFGCPAFEVLSPGEVAVCDTGEKLVVARFFWREKLFGIWRWRWSKKIKAPKGRYVFDAVLQFEDGEKPRFEVAFRDLPG